LSEGDELLEDARSTVLRWLRLGREPDAEAIAEAAELPVEVVVEALSEIDGLEDKSSFSEEGATGRSIKISLEGKVKDNSDERQAEVLREMQKEDRLNTIEYYLQKRKQMLRTELLHIYQSYRWGEKALEEDLIELEKAGKLKTRGTWIYVLILL